MTTSFNPVRDQIIYGALRLVGAYAAPDLPKPEQVQDALEALNLLLKNWQVEGFLWLKQFATLFLTPGQAKYLIPGAPCAVEFADTTLTANASGATITVASTAGMGAVGTVGIALDANVWHWDSVVAINGATEVVLSVGLPSSAAAGRPVVYYESALARPTRITQPTRRVWGGLDLPMGGTGRTISREEYLAIPNKQSPGPPLQAYYDPQRATGALYLWPVPTDCRDRVVFTCDRPIDDMVADTDTFDVPQEQLRRIKFALALDIAPEYALDSGAYDRLALQYRQIADGVTDYDREVADTQFMPGR